MKGWFHAQSSRDQVAIVALALALLLYIVVGLIYQPLQAKQQQLVLANQAASEDLQWMLGAAAKIKMAPAQKTKNASGGSLSQVIDSSVRRAGLTMKRFQPSGDNQAQVWLENVPYTATMTWLNELEVERGYRIESASVTAASQSGTVNVRIRVVAGA
ncbi:MAG TPA: type II secretion system protein M [Pseudomonadales bacterium]|nr:type II secretion system protein M [Pseudomonadales bacterium]